METGGIIGHIDVALLVLYAFFLFFLGLVYYLRREDKREGYPLESDRSDRIVVQGYPAIPSPKEFRLADGTIVQRPGGQEDRREIRAAPVAAWPGAPLEPTGDPMLDGVGPGSYAMRADVPDKTVDGEARIVPLRADAGFWLEASDPDPRGMAVVGADGAVAGKVCDVWVDRAEVIARYFEVDLGGKRVLLPVNFSRVDGGLRKVRVKSILARHFAGVPVSAHPDRVTLREEERIVAYYGAGTLYATPDRMGPAL